MKPFSGVLTKREGKSQPAKKEVADKTVPQRELMMRQKKRLRR